MKQSRAIAVVVLLWRAHAALAASPDEVNLSRYRYTVKMTAQASAVPVFVFEEVPLSVLSALCEDADGCTARLSLTLPSGVMRSAERSLFKAGTNWTPTGASGSYVDGDGGIGADVVTTTLVSGNACSFDEAETQVGSFPADLAQGFSVVAYYDGSGGGGSTPGFTCVLTLID
jgi:hypothetical protein